jgi:hypothetical protein
MDDIEEELKKIQYEIEIHNDDDNDELPEIKEVKEKPKPKSSGGRKGQSRERMMELHAIRSEKARLRKEEQEQLKQKQEEVEKIKKEKIEFEYEQAKQLKEAIDKKKAVKQPKIKDDEDERKEKKQLYKSASRDILKEKYLEEAKRRVMMDLFS